MPSGATDLERMLLELEVIAREEPYVYAVVRPGHPAIASAAATVEEPEGTTVVLRQVDADRLEVAYDFVAAWLTLTVHSSLAAVGLTAAVSVALAEEGISCNVLAGAFHDHLLVPVQDRTRALDALASLRERYRTADR
ncbi:ACT domain-containing protein [Amnibacterium endophyticum]|uniref:ACT domain-containing protein n=1 Tax=Amnibacterium endophyticum TaxID=2109337 RepID=A0ABW4LGC8_9MICO